VELRIGNCAVELEAELSDKCRDMPLKAVLHPKYAGLVQVRDRRTEKNA
jgi:hypothetical protein